MRESRLASEPCDPLGQPGRGMEGRRDAVERKKEKKADFLVDYKRFTPRVTKAFTEGGIVHVETRIEATLVNSVSTSEFFTTPSDGRSENRRSPRRGAPRRDPDAVLVPRVPGRPLANDDASILLDCRIERRLPILYPARFALSREIGRKHRLADG